MLGKDLSDRGAGGCLDLAVGIDEGEVEARGKPPAERGLARPHQPDQHDASVAEPLADFGELRPPFVFLLIGQN